MKLVGSELVLLHELVFDVTEVRKLAACGRLPTWCTRVRWPVEDIQRAVQLLAPGDPLAEQLRALAKTLGPSSPRAPEEPTETKDPLVHVLMEGFSLCTRKTPREWAVGHTWVRYSMIESLASKDGTWVDFARHEEFVRMCGKGQPLQICDTCLGVARVLAEPLR